MIYVFYGPDQFRAREELNGLRATLDTDGNLAHNTQRLEGRGLTPADLRAACHAASFFIENRLVIVEGLQDRFRAAGRGRGGRGRPARSDGSGEFDQFVDVLQNVPPTTTVVLLEEREPAALIEALAGEAPVKQFEVLKGPQLRAWAAARAQTQGGRFTPAALERLASLVDGNHLGEMAQEIDKLVTYANGSLIEVADIDAMVSASVQLQFWNLTDAVIEGRGERALSVLKAMNARDHPPQLLAFMLVRQYRQLLLTQALLREGLSSEQIGSRLGLSGYPLRKAVETAARYPTDRLETAYRKLLASDVAVKTGVLDIEVALELLVLELSELGRARGPARPASRTAPAAGGSGGR